MKSWTQRGRSWLPEGPRRSPTTHNPRLGDHMLTRLTVTAGPRPHLGGRGVSMSPARCLGNWLLSDSSSVLSSKFPVFSINSQTSSQSLEYFWVCVRGLPKRLHTHEQIEWVVARVHPQPAAAAALILHSQLEGESPLPLGLAVLS